MLVDFVIWPAAAHLLRSWVRIPPGAWIFVCCEYRVLSGTGLCDGLITRPEESYRLWCVAVCDLETSRMGAPYIYDISSLRVNDLTFILLTWRKWLAPNNASWQQMGFNSGFKGLNKWNRFMGKLSPVFTSEGNVLNNSYKAWIASISNWCNEWCHPRCPPMSACACAHTHTHTHTAALGAPTVLVHEWTNTRKQCAQ